MLMFGFRRISELSLFEVLYPASLSVTCPFLTVLLSFLDFKSTIDIWGSLPLSNVFFKLSLNPPEPPS